MKSHEVTLNHHDIAPVSDDFYHCPTPEAIASYTAALDCLEKYEPPDEPSDQVWRVEWSFCVFPFFFLRGYNMVIYNIIYK